MNNPFVTLCNTSASKNIDSNFVQTLEAMIFLNAKDLNNKINDKFTTELLVSIDKRHSKEKWIEHKIEHENGRLIPDADISDEDEKDASYGGFKMAAPLSLYKHKQKNYNLYNKDTFRFFESIHIGNFLVNKLSENLRRLYSANKGGGKVPKHLGSNIDSLKEQQKNIYKCLEIISPYIKFDNSPRTFENIFFGQVRHCSEAQAFYYLAMHEHLQPENEATHKKIFMNNLDVNDIDPIIIQDVVALSYPQSKSKFVSEMIALMPDDFFKEMNIYLTNQYRSSGSFMADAFMHCVKKNIELPNDTKLSILKGLLDSYSHWGKLPVEMAKPISEEIKEYISDIPLGFIRSGLLNPLYLHKNCATTICFHLMDKLTDPDVFWTALSSNVEPQQQASIFSKFDFSDQEVLLSIARKISSHGETFRQERMPQFIGIVGNYLENETLANILALDSSFIQFIQPLYMSKKLESELGEKSNEESVQIRKKMKI